MSTPPPAGTTGPVNPWSVVLPAIVDALLVWLFALIGRSAHDESLTLAGLAETARPFLGGLVLGYVVLHLTRRDHPPTTLVSGLVVWLCTALGGLGLRAATGQGTALPFVIVAITVLLLMLMAWRLPVALLARSRRR